MIFFIYDTETTGLLENSACNISLQPSIIQLYGMLMNEKGQVIDKIQFFCKPPQPISEIITKITRITNDMLKNKQPFSANASKLQMFVSRANAVIAQNLTFDKGLVDTEFKRLGKTFKWPKIQICTVEATEHLKGHRLHLSDLYPLLFGRDFKNAHRADVDTKALADCFFELRKRGIICHV